MNSIYLMRHGKSIGNQEGIIQGLDDYSLSKDGINELESKNYCDLLDIKKIYSSELKRASETAQIIKKKINYPGQILVDKRLNEVNLGVLNGKSKEYCAKNFPNYYEIFKKRGDYDLIEGAEHWIYTQARIISFLEKYLETDDEKDLIISHASYLRTFINMILGRYRNTQLNIENGFIYHYTNPLKNIEITNYDIAKSAIVKGFKCYDNTYIMKKKFEKIQQRDINEKEILKYLNNFFTTPFIIYMSDNNDYQVKISKYLEGIHKFGNLSYNDTLLLIKKVKLLNDCLKSYPNTSFVKESIVDELKTIKNLLIDDHSKEKVEELLNDEKFMNYLHNGEYNLVHNDLHRSNILFDNNSVHLLDFESIKLYPNLLQVASLICSSFLLEQQLDSMDAILNNWGSNLDVSLVNNLIDYRLLYGLAFFDEKIRKNNFNESDIEIKKKYLKALGGRK